MRGSEVDFSSITRLQCTWHGMHSHGERYKAASRGLSSAGCKPQNKPMHYREISVQRSSRADAPTASLRINQRNTCAKSGAVRVDLKKQPSTYLTRSRFVAASIASASSSA